MKVKIAEIGDLHFGIRDSERLYNELSIFKYFIKTNDIDIVQFNGDYFDRKMNLGEPASLLGIRFFSEVCEICKEKNIKIRIIEGTESHDLFQPRIFTNFAKDGLDLRFIERAEVEEINGLKILYLPEEYPQDSEEYYKEFKNQEYNLIFGHGAWDFVSFESMKENGMRKDINTAPVFIWNEWKKTVPHGLIVFGHIHGRNIYKVKKAAKIIYPGAFTRWGFDEISPRGFTYIEYDTDKKYYTYQLIDNTAAPIYQTVDVSSLEIDFDNVSLEEIKTTLDKEIEKANYTRFDFSRIPDEKVTAIRKLYKDNNLVAVKVKDKKEVTQETGINDEFYQKYRYLLDNQLPLDEVIFRFIKEEYKEKVPLEYIRETLLAKE